MADDEIILINVPGPGDPTAVEVVSPGDGVTTIPSGGLGSDVVQEMIDDSIDVHVEAVEPHPAYDDLPSLSLIFENGLV